MTTTAPVSGRAVSEPSFDDLPDGTLVIDRNGRVKLANLAFLSLIERPQDEVVGQPLESLWQVCPYCATEIVPGFPALEDLSARRRRSQRRE